MRAGWRLGNWLLDHDIALVFGSEAQCRCFPHQPRQVRKPDASVILRSRLPKGPLPEGIVEFRPDLVVEVVSPNDRAEDIYARMDDFRQAGTPLVWVLYPKARRVFVHAGSTVRELGPEDHLDAEPVLPGFRVKVADLFVA